MGSLPLRFFRLESPLRRSPGEAFGGQGGLHAAGRWHSQGTPVVYAADSIPLAYLEILAHLFGHPTENRLLFEIEIPERHIETRTAATLPDGWDLRPPGPASRSVGDRWLQERRSVALRIPSVIVRQDWNVLINPLHPAFELKWAKPPTVFPLDPRIASKAKGGSRRKAAGR